MKLLIFTQSVDTEDPVLGFFHEWIKRLSQKYSSIIVVGLRVGKYDLPENVKVLSLGKETGRSKLKYIFRFYKYIWNERKNYDKVFVHMNAEYVVLGGLLWKILGKKISLWYNHTYGSIYARVGKVLTDTIFFTSPYAYMAKNGGKKAKQMPVGINTNLFKPVDGVNKKENSLLFISRISPVKKLKELVEALVILDKENIDFTFTIAGEESEGSEEYFKEIKNISKDLESKGKISYLGSVPNYKTPSLYQNHEVFLNLTQSGSFDKTIVEAMATGSLVLVLNESLKDFLSTEFIFQNSKPEVVAERIKKTLLISGEEKTKQSQKNIEYVTQMHSLDSLVEKLSPLI